MWNTEYGWRKNDLKVVYNTFIHSRIHYAAAAWQPWLSDTNIGKLDALQNRSMRIMSGQVASTPKEALRAEMDAELCDTAGQSMSPLDGESEAPSPRPPQKPGVALRHSTPDPE